MTSILQLHISKLMLIRTKRKNQLRLTAIDNILSKNLKNLQQKSDDLYKHLNNLLLFGYVHCIAWVN